MGDDPYDFDIAIPSGDGAGGGKAKSYSSQRYAGSSSSGSNDGSISASDEEDDEEDEESVDARKPTTKQQQQQQQQPAQLSARRASATTTAASSSSSALDKAKNFLSKYSTKAIDTKPNKTHASSRSSRRVELSFDESMDFSQDESGEDKESREEKQCGPKSTQSKRPASSGSTPAAKRVTLSDSEDYGITDSDEEAPRKTKSAANAAQSNTRVKKEESQSDDDDDDTSLRRSITIEVTKPKTPGVSANRSVDSNYEDEEDDVDDVIASFIEESDEGDPPPFSAVSSFKTSTAVSTATKIEPKPAISHVTGSQPSSNTYCNVIASNGDYNDEEESIASKSDYVESFEEENFPINAKPSVTASAPKAAVSESGAYEEEDFDEESGVTPLATAASTAVPSRLLNTVQSIPLEDSSKMEPNFDYSMDFSDDNAGEGKLVEVKPTALAALSISEARTQPVREEASSSSSSTSHNSDQRDYSDFLDSGGSDRNEAESELPRLVAQHAGLTEERHTSLHQVSDPSKLDYVGATNAAPPFVVAAPDPHARCDVDADAYATNPEPIKSQVAVEEHAAAAAAKRLKPQAIAPSHLKTHSEPSQPPPLPVRTASSTRARILIVREYEQPTREKTEMRDASTQFTGNHAAIQADLTPDGMHSLFAGPSPRTPGVPLPLPPTQHHLMSQQSAQNLERDQSCQPADVYPHVATPLPPPEPSILSSPGYSMDVLRLPTATTTSIYKQQLQALQQQILVKKRETERLVQERMAFQYSTLRGTERIGAVSDLRFLNSWYAEEVSIIESTRKAGVVAGSHAR